MKEWKKTSRKVAFQHVEIWNTLIALNEYGTKCISTTGCHHSEMIVKIAVYFLLLDALVGKNVGARCACACARSYVRCLLTCNVYNAW